MFVILAMYDQKTEAFSGLFTERSIPAALRSFGDSLRTERDTPVAAHPEDYDLVQLGTYDELTGRIEVLTPVVIKNAAAVVRELRAAKVAEDINAGVFDGGMPELSRVVVPENGVVEMSNKDRARLVDMSQADLLDEVR